MLDRQPHTCASDRGVSHVPQSEQTAANTLQSCYAIASSKTDDSEKLDDCAMDAWIAQDQASDQFENRNGAALSTFLGVVVRNSVADRLRHESRLESRHQSTARDGANIDHPIPDSDVRPDLAADRFYAPDQYAEYADTLNLLFEVAADLPPRQQMLLERHCLGACDSIKVLAEEFNCTVQSLYQARKALFQKLDCAGVSAPQ